MRRCGLALVAVLLAAPAVAAEPGTAPVPKALDALRGCWRGKGEVQGKPVRLQLNVLPILADAMLRAEADSVALADPSDHYAALLLFGGSDAADGVVGYWADSFGGAFAAPGKGQVQPGGFDIVYSYPDSSFVNRWRVEGTRLRWRIAARNAAGTETPFASYDLMRMPCQGPPASSR
jgi:hypothetical protein